jgi:branched-chain amino acid transport system permease protein
MGFNIIFNSTGVINFAQGEFAVFGGLLTYTFAVILHLPIMLAAVIAVICSALIGAAMERLVVYPLRRAQIINIIIATIGVSILLKALARVLWPEEAYKVPEFTSANFTLLGVTQRSQIIWVFLLTILAVTITYLFFNHTRVGKAMKACSINRQAASLVGINVSRMSLYSFALSGALGGAAGLINAPYASYNLGLFLGVKGFTSAVIGGLGNTFGAVFGGLMVGLAEELIAGFLQVVFSISSGYRDAVTALLLVMVLLIRPQGLFGTGERIKV